MTPTWLGPLMVPPRAAEIVENFLCQGQSANFFMC